MKGEKLDKQGECCIAALEALMSCGSISPSHREMGLSAGSYKRWQRRGAPRRARGGGMHAGPEEELPVLTFTRFTGAIEFVSEMRDGLNQLSH